MRQRQEVHCQAFLSSEFQVRAMLQDSFQKNQIATTTQNKNKTNKVKTLKKGLALVATGIPSLKSGSPQLSSVNLVPRTSACPRQLYLGANSINLSANHQSAGQMQGGQC